MQEFLWDDLRVMLEVVRAGSVTAAAKRLNVNQTTVSRRINALESALNAPLFDRSSKGWLITPVGESLLPSLETIADEVLKIGRSVQADRQELSGKLRVTATDACIQGLLMTGLNGFCQRYPAIDIELIATEDTLDLSSHDADIAFRATNEPPPNVVGTHIADFSYATYATPAMVDRYLDSPQSVGGITWKGDGYSVPTWMRKGFPGMAVRYRANSLSIAFNMARQGLGFTLLPCGLGDMSSRLVRVPMEYQPPTTGFWLLCHIDLRTTARIRIFRDYMLEQVKPYIPLIEGRRPRPYPGGQPAGRFTNSQQ